MNSKLTVFFFLAVAPALHGQAVSANLIGSIQDATGAAVANATVDVLNSSTSVRTSARANAGGEYRFTNLPAGTYSVTAAAAGFAPASLNGVLLDVNKTATVNVTLQVGQVASAVDVIEAPANIDTTTATIGASFSSRESRDLPTSSIGLGVLNLALLNAGVASNGGLNVGRGPSVGGQRPRNNNFTVEGVDNNNKSVTGALITLPNDATQEFSVLQNQFSAEFGHSSGGQFNVLVKSGTNNLHGSLYEYFQNRNLNAIDQAFASSGTLGNPRYDLNRFGGTVGGPVVKNKLFYFGNYEYSPTGQASTPGQILTPTQKGYATLAAIPGLNPTNLGILKQYAAPASTPVAATEFPVVAGVPVEAGILAVAGPNYINGTAAVGSGDYNISERDQLRVRYVYNRQIQLDHKANLPVFYQVEPISYHLATLSEYHNFTPAVTNELRLGFNRFISSTPAGDYKFPGLDAFPNLQFSDLGGLNIGPNPNAPQSASQNTYQLTDNLSWTKGSHTLQFGFDGRKLIAPNHFAQRARGDYEYSTLDLYLRDITPDLVAQRTLGNPTFYGDQFALYGYVNDGWRVRPNITLNLGLRYEYTTVPFSQKLQALNAISNVPGLLIFGEPKAQTKNFAPRIGLAWSPGAGGVTSIRAGFGMAYDVSYDNIGVNSPPPQFSTTADVSGAGTPNFLANGGIRPSAQGGAPLSPAEARAATSAWLPDQKLPYSIQWNLGIQHVFLKDYTLEVRYLGTRGVHLNVQQRINKFAPVTPANSLPTFYQAPSQATLDALPLTLTQLKVSNILPRYAAAGFTNGAFVEDAPIGNSTYHGLAVQFNKRFSHDLHFTSAYTWSHLIDDSTADFNTTVLTPRRPQDFQNLRADRSSSALDHRQRLTFGAIYDVPLFRKSGWMLKNLAGNWSVAPLFTYETPEYVTVLSQTDSNLNGDSASDRTIVNPNGLDKTGSGVTALTSIRNGKTETVGYLAINPNARYIQAGPGAYANGGRNTLPGRPIDNIDLNLLKSFPLREGKQLQFSAQFYNLLNHPQFVP
ncbi:MAG: carboxypeptidase regulatory-like domain-containing protein, partial [Acidobacteriota bacterium]